MTMDTNQRRSPVEMLAEDFAQRLQAGEEPTIEEYAADYPSYAGEIRRLFPVIAVLESSKPADGRKNRARSNTETSAPKVFGDYEIVREIGRGGMGVVYEARQRSLGRSVALKVLPANYLPSPKHVLRFKREAQSAARLHHTNIVPVFGVGEQDGSHYYVMQYIEGHAFDTVISCLRDLTANSSDKIPRLVNPSLETDDPRAAIGVAQRLVSSKLTTEQGAGARAMGLPTAESEVVAAPTESQSEDEHAFSRFWHFFVHPTGIKLESYFWRNVAGIGMQVARALQHAHDQGVLHRDIKPSNLMIDTTGKVWVTDFGLAWIADQDALTESHDTVGTLRYMAPEQLRGECDARTEIYNLGLTLYEIATLEPAYHETDHRLLLAHQIAQQPPVRPRVINPSIPRDLETIILKTIASDPEKRYPSADDLADDFRRFLAGDVIRAGRTSAMGTLWHWCKRNKAIARLAAAVMILLATVAVIATVGYVRTNSALSDATVERENADELQDRIDWLEERLRQLEKFPPELD